MPMRRSLVLALLVSCAHGPLPIAPDRWHELRTEHFVVRTDLALDDARRVAVDLEEVRAGLLAASWHRSNLPTSRTQVIMLGDGRELHDYAMKGIEGFVAADAFGEPIMVVSGDEDPKEQRFLKHELSHVISNQFLVRNPRWVSEGLACYLETLRFDRRRGRFVVGEWSSDRVWSLRNEAMPSYWDILRTGREAEHMSAHEGWIFETGSWALVRWLVDDRLKGFEDFLARGEDKYYAFSAAFPDLTESKIRAGVNAYLKLGKAEILTVEVPRWSGAVAERALPPAEVYALLADLQRLSPGFPRTPERDMRKASLLGLALQSDPGNPLALQLSDTTDATAATKAHPDDWRAWLVFADKNQGGLAALQTAARLAPDVPGVLIRLAGAESEHGTHELALEHALRAVEIAPGRPDLLGVLAVVQANAGHCAAGLDTAQRAVDFLPDDAPLAAAASLKNIRREIEGHCQKVEAARNVVRRMVGTPKGCSGAGPRLGRRDTVKGPLKAEFIVRADGTVADVKIDGVASAGALAAVKRYVESCKYEPTIEDGKPVEVRWQVEFNVR